MHTRLRLLSLGIMTALLIMFNGVSTAHAATSHIVKNYHLTYAQPVRVTGGTGYYAPDLEHKVFIGSHHPFSTLYVYREVTIKRKNGSRAIYKLVMNADGTLGGWIHRSYLKPVKTDQAHQKEIHFVYNTIKKYAAKQTFNSVKNNFVWINPHYPYAERMYSNPPVFVQNFENAYLPDVVSPLITQMSNGLEGSTFKNSVAFQNAKAFLKIYDYYQVRQKRPISIEYAEFKKVTTNQDSLNRADEYMEDSFGIIEADLRDAIRNQARYVH